MIRGLMSLYGWNYANILVYMLQSTEYEAGPYLRWFWHTNDFSRVMYRRSLDKTGPARMLVLALRLGMLLQIAAGLLLLALWVKNDLTGGLYFGLAVLLSYPIIWAHAVTVPLWLGRIVIIQPRHRMYIKESEKIFKAHPGAKIAIAGSYGKTSMKELLLTVLGEGKKVVATPANKNVSISHAYFAKKLDGNEDVVILEYGENVPGDIERFAKITHPTHALITGIAPAHLNHYKTVANVIRDMFSVANYVKPEHLYVNGESALAAESMHKGQQRYDSHGALGWKVSDIQLQLSGTSFVLTKGNRKMRLHSDLLGRHQVGPLSLAAALAAEFDMSNDQIQAAIAKTRPFEHRMQPYELDGAWIIDDTYNGNIEGIRAGTALLAELDARRKIYVTPGLVDQGQEGRAVHREMGQLIAKAAPTIVVLMKNSATDDILYGLKAAKFEGDVVIEDDPLNFYTNLQTFVAHGDLVLMQNDWTDNYA